MLLTFWSDSKNHRSKLYSKVQCRNKAILEQKIGSVEKTQGKKTKSVHGETTSGQR